MYILHISYVENQLINFMLIKRNQHRYMHGMSPCQRSLHNKLGSYAHSTKMPAKENVILIVNLLRYTNWLLCSIEWHYQEVFWGQLTISS